MSLSKERAEYHLTPEGWVEGSFYGDAVGGRVIRDIPEDRVLEPRRDRGAAFGFLEADGLRPGPLEVDGQKADRSAAQRIREAAIGCDEPDRFRVTK